MNKMAFDVTPDERVFESGRRTTLADALAACEAEMTSNALRDTRSAFRFLERRCGIDLGGTLARPEEVRAILGGLSPTRFDVSGTHIANIQSRIRTAVRRFGMRRIWVTREIPLDANWAALMGSIPNREHRWGLSRLACYCTAKRIAPTEVTPETLRGLLAALEAEALSKNPRNLLKHTIAVWNMCLRRVPDWPGSPLSSPFRKEPFMLPLEAFPVAFRQAVAAFEARMSRPDPLDPAAPVRASCPDTLESYRYTFRRAASALVRGGHVELDAVTGFEVFFEAGNFKEALRPFLPKSDDQDTGYVHKKAIQLITVARQHLGQENRLDRWAKPSRDNKDRLLPATVIFARVLSELADRARGPLGKRRDQLSFRDTLLVAVLTVCPVRLRNIAMMQIGRHIQHVGEEWRLRFDAHETKTDQPLHLALPREFDPLLEIFLGKIWPAFPRAEGDVHLWPGQKGGPMAEITIYKAVTARTRALFGIAINPHAFRSIAATFLAESSPADALHARPLLGHRQPETTERYYVRASQLQAARNVSTALRAIRGS